MPFTRQLSFTCVSAVIAAISLTTAPIFAQRAQHAQSAQRLDSTQIAPTAREQQLKTVVDEAYANTKPTPKAKTRTIFRTSPK